MVRRIHRMIRLSIIIKSLGLLAFLVLFFVPVSGIAQPSVEISGTVRNGTTGKPVKGQRLILLSPSHGMEEAGSTESDNQGRFKFEKVTGPFFVIQTHYDGANYDTPVRPQDRGPTETNVTVYDSTTSDANVKVTLARWRFVPGDGKLRIDEVFVVSNNTDPPRSLVRSDGAFKFGIPAGATVEAASVMESAGMPLPQTPREILPGKLDAIDRPIQPGTTRIGIQFSADYGQQSFDFSQTLAHSLGELDLLLPPDMQVSGIDAFQPGSAENAQGFQVLTARDRRANEAVRFRMTGGTAPAEQASGGEGGEQSDVTQLPNAIGAIQVPLVSMLGLVVLWSLGFALFQQTSKGKKAAGLTPEKKKQLLDQKDYLIRRILELDARFAAKEISERDYHLQRSRLKSKCAVLMGRLQAAPARKRAKTVA